MRHFGCILMVLLAMSVATDAQITKTATFEKYTAGQGFNPSFTDPISGINSATRLTRQADSQLRTTL